MIEIKDVIEQLKLVGEEKEIESRYCTRGRLTTNEMIALSTGYNMAIKDLETITSTVKENKIEPLSSKLDESSLKFRVNGSSGSMNPPDNWELMKKINEIIAYINKEDK